jgi:hypothetical protein
MRMTKSSKYAGYTIRISARNEVTLRRPSGRAIGWAYAKGRDEADMAATDLLCTFQGAALDDRRIKTSAMSGPVISTGPDLC